MNIENQKNSDIARLDLNVGDYYITVSYGEIVQIVKIEDNIIHFQYRDRKSTFEITINEINKYHRIYGDIKNFEKNYLNFDKINRIINEEVEESTSTDLELRDKNKLLKMEQSLQYRINEIKVMRSVLEKKRMQLNSVVHDMEKQVSRIRKVVNIIELYLGIKEEVVTIREGKKSDKNKISIRQLILYMDEEIGIRFHYDGGIDFKKINEFDDWIILNKNLERLIPEEKAIVAFKVRRESSQSMLESLVNGDFSSYLREREENDKIYFLIKNGECLYRIWSSLDIHSELLFPSRENFETLYSKLDEDSFDGERAKDEILKNKKIALYLRGLVERSGIFNPLKYDSNKIWENIDFIYDGTKIISDGIETFKEWQKKINSEVKVGSRIYFRGFRWNDFDRDHEKNRGYDYVYFNHHIYQNPPPGIYEVKDIKDRYDYGGKTKMMLLNYNPGDDVFTYNSWGEYRYGHHKRKKAISFYIPLYQNEKYLNYDLIELKKINYYINSRYNRRDYIDMLPILFDIREIRLEELKLEKEIINDICILFKNKIDENFVKKVVTWWKMKNKIKRPILKSEKAYRMCVGKIKRYLEKEK